MRPIELPWETWRAVIAVLREKGLPYMLEQHGPSEAAVILSLTDDILLRSDTWVRWQLGIPLASEG